MIRTLLLVVALAACGKKAAPKATTPPPAATGAADEDKNIAPGPSKDNGSTPPAPGGTRGVPSGATGDPCEGGQ